MRGEDANGRRAVGALVRDLIDEAAALVRGEARLARIEATRTATAVSRGTAFVALGSVFAILGLFSLVLGVILLAGDQWLPGDLYWLAALIVVVATGGVAIFLVKRGLARLSPSHIAPLETAASVKENASWVKRQLTSGGTSR